MDELNNHKLVLCGPILRKVTSHSVAVFLALKEPKLIELQLHENAEPGGPILYSHHSLSKALVDTVALGAHLHVALVQLDLAGTPGLVPGQLYGYNLLFRDPGNPDAAGIDLSSEEVKLIGEFSEHIGCNQGKLPAFSLSPRNFDQFNIVHGSCRKPHGGGKDMLAKMDDLLQTPHARSIEDQSPPGIPQYEDPLHRPHLLLLTGDQIYADDVAPPLLRTLHNAAKIFLGWREEIPNTAMPGGFADKIKPLHGALKNKNKALWDLLNSITKVQLNEHYSTITTNLTEIRDAIQTVIDDFPEIWDFDPFIVSYNDLEENLSVFLTDTNTWININQDNPDFMWEFIQDYLRRRTTLKDRLDFFLNLASDRHWGQIEVTSDPITPDASAIETESDRRWAAYHQLPKQDLILSRIAPPQRALELKEFAAMTSDEMEGHLLFLSDFYMMYLFSWSDEPWPKDDDGHLKVPYYWDSVPNYSLFGDLSKSSLIRTREKVMEFARGLRKVRRVLANIPTLMIFDDHEVTDDWNLNEEWVLNVNKRSEDPVKNGCGPHLLRNALAAYAIFQDWGNRPEDYLAGQAGALILENLRFENKAANDDGEPTDLRPNIVSSEGVSNEVLFDVFRLGAHAYDASTYSTHAEETIIKNQLQAAGIKKWHWTYDPYADSNESFFKLFALDTRTWREFPSTAWNLQYQHLLKEGFELQKDAYIARRGPANLIHPEVLGNQLEELSGQLLNLVISPAPVFGLPLLEDGLQRMSAMNGSVEAADYESWQGNHRGFKQFREKLAHKKVVLLSGDVHYAYTNYLKFFDENGEQITTAMAQLCSSSMKNETMMTEALGSAGRSGHILEFLAKPFSTSAVEWGKLIPTFTDGIMGIKDRLDNVANFPHWFMETAPIMPWNDQARVKYYLDSKDHVLFNFEMLLPDGLWQMGRGAAAFVGRDFFFGHLGGIYDRSEGKVSYRILFMKDRLTLENDPEGKRLAQLTHINKKTDEETEEEITPNILAKDWEGHWDEMREVIGYNNIARIFFHAEADDLLAADSLDHYLYWQPHKYGKTLDLLSYTCHKVPLKTGPSSWANFKAELVDLAQQEFIWWNPAGKAQVTETKNGQLDPEAWAKLEKYYTVAGLSAEFPEQYPGIDLIWGAAFISYLMKMSQAGAEFTASTRTIDFMRAAKKNRVEEDLDNRFWLYDLHEIKPEAGDLLCNWRNVAFNYADIDPDADSFRAAQCAVIVSISEEGLLRAISGNISDSVDEDTLSLSDDGFVLAGTPVQSGGAAAYNAIIRIRSAKDEPNNT